MTSIRGSAGSGKTTMMQEAVRAVAALAGKDVFVVAPSSNKDLSATDRCFEGCGVRFERRQDRKRFF